MHDTIFLAITTCNGHTHPPPHNAHMAPTLGDGIRMRCMMQALGGVLGHQCTEELEVPGYIILDIDDLV